MTRYFFIVTFILISTQLKAQLSETIRVEESDLSFSRMEEFDCVTWEKSYEFTEQANAPKLPVIIESFIIPFDAQVTNIDVVVTGKNLLNRSLLIVPVDPPISIGNNYATSSLKPDGDIYNSSLAYPTENVKIISDVYEHGYHVVTVEVCPFEYVPLNKALSLLDLTFTINYMQSREVIEYPQYQSSKSANRSYRFVYSKVKNKQDMNRFSNQRTGIVSNESLNMNERSLGVSNTIVNIIPEYLIVTNNELKSTFQRLADWKTKKGVPTVVMTIEEVQEQNEGCDLAEKIRNYLKKCRQNWGDDFFVLLGGDTNIIPPRMATNGPDRNDYRYGEYKNDSTIRAQDLYYTALDGNWNINNNHIYNEYYQFLNPNTGQNMIVNIDQADFGRDIYLGRAPVKNISEAENFVNKVLIYEKANTNIDYSYVLNTLNVDAFIDKNENTGYLHDDARSSIDGYYSSEPYSQLHPWFLFDHYNCTCNKHSRYVTNSRGEELNKSNFMAALQNGGNSGLNHFHLVYHMDHSSPRGMGASSLDKNEAIYNMDVDQLTNGNYLQIVLSSGCEPATFNEDCIAEHFINNLNGGAVAYMGNADRGWSGEYLQFKSLLEVLYSNESTYHNLGYVFQATIGSRNSNNCRLTLLGDPEMPVWTAVPQTLNVSVTPNAITNGENTISIQINNLPVNQEALVCLMKEGEGYSTLTINDRAVHSFTFTPYTSGVVDVTVTTNNFRPYEAVIPVSVSPKAILHVSDLIFDDDKQGESNGNSDKQLDAGETVELSVSLKNDGGAISDVVTGILTCNSSEINIINESISFGEINAGGSRMPDAKFVFTIDKDCNEHLKSGQDPIEFMLTMQNGTNTISEKFQVDVFAPEIEIGNQKVNWTSNGNVTIEPNETIKMKIDLINMGKAQATGLKAKLVSNNEFITCPNIQIDYPTISFSETKVNLIDFQFRTSTNLMFDLTLQVSNEYGKTWNFPVNPLFRPAPISLSTVNFQPYSSSININWIPIADIVGYNIYRSNNGENGVYQKLNKFPLKSAYYLDDNLAERTVYHYKVAAISANGNESDWSAAYKTWTTYPVVSPFPRSLDIGAYATESCPNIADVDNDGKQEIFWLIEDRYSTRTGYVMGFRPNGEELYDIDGNVTTVSGFAKTPVLIKGQAAFGDLAGNGEQNIVVSTWDDIDGREHGDKNAVYCYSPFDRDGDHKPDLLWEKKIPYSMHQSPVVANLDGSSDGTMEVILKSHQTPDIYILDHNGNELRRLNPNVADLRNCNYSALTVADLDDDGQMEIIASYDFLGIYIWRQDGSPFTVNPFWGAGILKLASAPVVCDLNEDGKKELLFSQNDVAVSHVYAISLDGDKTVAGWNGSQTIPYTDNGFSLDHTLSVGDINNDGHLEVVILGHGCVKAWKHTGEEIFNQPIEGLFPQIDYAANVNSPILADVDGDAIPDIVFCCNNYIYALHNDGKVIVGFPIISDSSFKEAPCVDDIDNDGKNELVAGNDHDLYVWKTDGVPTAVEWSVARGNPQNTNEYFPMVCKPTLINSDETFGGESPCGNVILQSGRLVIPAGKTMTLNNTSAVIVRTGAVLEVDGGNILNARLVVQKGGTLIIKNNGLIKLRNKGDFDMEKGAMMNIHYGKIDVTKF